MFKYPLAVSSWGDEEIKAMQAVIELGHFTMGKSVQDFEKVFSQYVSSKYSVMCSSGSAANLLMVAALFYKKNNALKAGDEVIVPAVSWSTTYYPLYQYNLKLKFVDVDLETLNYDLSALGAAITNKTRAIMTVNLLGNPNNFDQINSLIAGKEIYLIEDNCESLGAQYKGKQCGTFGCMGTYSSFFSHHISTMEGGVVVTDDEELYHILLCLRAHGWTRNLPTNNHVCGTKSSDPFEESYRFVLPGYNVRPLELSGAIGVEQMKKLAGFIEKRRQNAAVFQELFGGDKNLLIQQQIGASSWFGFSFIIKKNAPFDRKTIIKHFEENGVECRPIVAGNFAKNEVLKWFNYEIFGTLNNADMVDKNGFFIGNHQVDKENDLRKVHQIYQRLLENLK